MLDAARIRWSGAGDDDYVALQPTFWNEHGVAVAFLGQCNRTGREYNYQPFLDAAYNKPGFAYLIEPNLENAIAGARPLADLVVVQLHAGIEYTTGPGTMLEPGVEPEPGEDGNGTPAIPGGDRPPVSAADLADATGPQPGQPIIHFPTRPSLSDRQLRYRAVDAGADVVICHHPHVLQGFEVYHGVLIAHSLGNFVFDQSYAETMPSLILKAEFDKEGFSKFTFRPAFVDNMIPHMVTGRLGREILDRQADYSREMKTIVTVDPSVMQGRSISTRPLCNGPRSSIRPPLRSYRRMRVGLAPHRAQRPRRSLPGPLRRSDRNSRGARRARDPLAR